MVGVVLAVPACGAVTSLSPKAPPAIAASARAPGFTLPASKPGTNVDLATTLAASDVVLVFYRGHW